MKTGKVGIAQFVLRNRGNVWQRCEDWYNARARHRVLRGASWGNYDPDRHPARSGVGVHPARKLSPLTALFTKTVAKVLLLMESPDLQQLMNTSRLQ